MCVALVASLLLGLLLALGCARQPPDPPLSVESDTAAARMALPTACDETAARWRRMLGERGAALACPPFVVAGDLTEGELRRAHAAWIAPLAAALQAEFFDRPPHEPISVFLFRDEATYRAESQRLFGDGAVSPLGHYRPHLRIVAAHLGGAAQGTVPFGPENDTGIRTKPAQRAAPPPALCHELTHALMDFDFADAPPWLAEGLAALCEAVAATEDGRLEFLPNARLATAARAMAAGRLPPLEELLAAERFAGPEIELRYAHACAFCSFLNERGCLAAVYRQARAGAAGDRQGRTAVRTAFARQELDAVDAALRAFIAASHRPAVGQGRVLGHDHDAVADDAERRLVGGL